MTAPLPEGDERSPNATGLVVERSLLLPKLFEGLSVVADGPTDDQEPRPARETTLTVLDVGPAVPETVAFFSRYRCRLYVADLFPEQPERQGEGETEDEPFQTLLDYPVQVQFDLCLFWDFLNLLDMDQLKAFNVALRPFVHRGTRAHGFAAMNAAHALSINTYGVRSTDELIVRPDPGGRRATRPHPQAMLNQALTCLEVKRGTLLREGRLEVLFHGP